MPRAAHLLSGNAFDLFHVLQFFDRWAVLPSFALLDLGGDPVMTHAVCDEPFFKQVLQVKLVLINEGLQFSDLALRLTD